MPLYLWLSSLLCTFLGVITRKEDLKQLYPYALSFVTFLIISLPLLPFTIESLLEKDEYPSTMGLKGLDVVSYKVFNALSEYHRFLMALFFVLFIIGIFFFWKIDKAKTILLVGLLAIPILISIYLSETMPMTCRYLIYLFLSFSWEFPFHLNLWRNCSRAKMSPLSLS